MRRLSIAFTATFAILVGLASHASAAGPGHLVVYPATDGDADAYFVKAFDGRRLLTMIDYNKTSRAGMIIVRLKDPRLGVTESNLLPIPRGRLKILVHRISSGDELQVLTQSQSGQVSSQSLAVSQTNSLTATKNTSQSVENAKDAVVVVPIVGENRALLLDLVRSNFLGLNTPAIAAIELQYEEMWAQDVSAMSGYHASASATALFDKVVESAP